MDALSSVLDLIHLNGVVYFIKDFHAPWGLNIEGDNLAQFHVITRGECLFSWANHSPIRLSTGDIVIFPVGTAHWLADSAGSKKHNGQKVIKQINRQEPVFDGHGYATTLICGHFAFDRITDHPFLSSLPECIHLTNLDRTHSSSLDAILTLLIKEMTSKSPGSDALVKKMAELLFIQCLKDYMRSKKETKGFLTALLDPHLSRTMEQMHSSPEKPWTLTSLAKISGISRTGLINKFKRLLGDTPGNYFQKWKLLKSCELLQNPNAPISDIASSLGYSSDAAFNKFFKRNMKITPSKYRREHKNTMIPS